MDTLELERDRELIERILREHAEIPYAYDQDITTYTLFDHTADRYARTLG